MINIIIPSQIFALHLNFYLISIKFNKQLINKQIKEMSNAIRPMSTEQIKKGLENIKKAQLQVLRQLRGESFLIQRQNNIQQNLNNSKHSQAIAKHEDKQNQKQRYRQRQIQNQRQNQRQRQRQRQNQRQKYEQKHEQNNQNKQMNGNILQTSNIFSKNERYQNKTSIQTSQSKSIKTNESMYSSTQVEIQKMKRQFNSEREQLNSKLIEITNKLDLMQRQSLLSKNQQKNQQNQLLIKVKFLQDQKSKLQWSKRSLQRQVEEFQIEQRKYKAEIELKVKEKIILQTQIQSFKAEISKLIRTNKQLQTSLKQMQQIDKESKQLKKQFKNNQYQNQNHNQFGNRINVDFLMTQLRTISSNHDFLFSKLKQSDSFQKKSIQKQSQIQNSFGRILQYLEVLSSSTSANYANQNIKRSMTMISQSRVEQQDQLEYFVRQMGQNNSVLLKRQKNQLKQQNQNLKNQIKNLSSQLNNLQKTLRNEIGQQKNNKFTSQSNRLVILELQQMKEEVLKMKKYKQEMRQEKQEHESQYQKIKIKCKQFQAKLEQTERKLAQANNNKFTYEKRCQDQQIQINSLNSIIKQLNRKISSPQAENSSLSQVRQQFAKLLQTNSLLIRQKQSLKAMNQGLQVQVHNLKYEKDQYEANNKQKHELISRQIKQRNHLVQEIDKKQLKTKQLKEEVQRLKNISVINQQQQLKIRKQLDEVIQQRNQQILKLRKQIQEFYKQSRQNNQIRFKYDKLQIQYKDLFRKSTRMGQTLTHLWSVKEAQYYNINQILGMLRNPQNSNYSMQNNSLH